MTRLLISTLTSSLAATLASTLASTSIALFSVLALPLIACGGGGPSRPGPLSHTFDEVFLDQLSMEKKDEMFKSQHEFTRARGAHRKADADLAEERSLLQVAKNELAQAKLEENSAGEKKKTAEASGDMNKINPAMKDARVAELARRAADEKISARKAKIKHLEKVELYAQEELYHREARLEQTKAKLARDNNIKPKDFSYDKYEKQVQDRSKRAQKAKSVADKEEQKANEAKAKWEKARQQVEAARGGGM